ncbi:hypothetical protein JHK82_020274 [Glycine max]|uniref:Uncharacterized protein n=2 Tax=Glycine subgen. Soja TaxID=1462606 RepID=A0A0R0IFV4_SOYBN|nr:hypothetical protein JHK85_020729 [Glycine max]RZB94921.1 hypothetical protein D0Y65_019419 [Glycine soja]KAG5024376.1 hypothetical protein JHK86_020290 [Glycine max]KAG5135543.1 hypothetical protein JHK82_020274 [Glycine max]KAH1049319.1 hypothetical protein GYH30_020038 [Glycine max]
MRIRKKAEERKPEDDKTFYPEKFLKLLTQEENSNRNSLEKRKETMENSTSTEKHAKIQPPKSRILKEKRAKLYIIRRCIVMLLCWKENGDQ